MAKQTKPDARAITEEARAYLASVIAELKTTSQAAAGDGIPFFPNGIDLIEFEISIGSPAVDTKISLKVAGGEEMRTRAASPDLQLAKSTRPELTDELCDAMAVDSTPAPERYEGDPAQLLATMKVVNSAQTRRHRRSVQARLKSIGWSIKQAEITSGPAVAVLGCRKSIQENAA